MRTVLALAVSVFALEVLVMVGLGFFPLAHGWQETLADSIALTILLVPALYAFIYRPLTRDAWALAWANHRLEENACELERQIRAKTDDLLQANLRLEAQIEELRQRDRENALLSEMVKLLQSCARAEEAYSIINRTVLQLFPGWHGGLYVMSPSRKNLEMAISWGEPGLCREVFPPEDCWALRSGITYGAGTIQGVSPCSHVTAEKFHTFYCVPLTAQGLTLGVLTLAYDGAIHPALALDPIRVGANRIIGLLPESVALALGNVRLHETLRDQSIRDPLTGLFNRRYLSESLEREASLARRRGLGLGVAMIDIDHFKDFNDTHGHAAGDAALCAVAAYLQAHVRDSDIVCRYGGEEFTALFQEDSPPAMAQRCEVLRRGIEALEIRHDGQPLAGVTISLGLAIGTHETGDPGSLLKAADAALYQAKSSGRNCVCVADPAEAAEGPCT